MLGRLRWLLVLTLWLAGSQVASAGEEGNRATGRRLFQEASTAMQQGDYATAADLYARSNAIFPAPTATLGQARALVKLGRLLDAYERYSEIAMADPEAAPSDAFRQAILSARKERELVFARLPSLVITVEGEGKVSLDGKPVLPAALGVKQAVNPGEHRITAPGVEEVVTVREGQVLEVPIRIPAGTLPAESAAELAAGDTSGGGDVQRITGYALIGLGGASILASFIIGGVYVGARRTVDDECDELGLCSQEGLDATDRARGLGTANLITLFGGVAAAGVGLMLVLTTSGGEEVAVGPAVGPGVAGLSANARW